MRGQDFAGPADETTIGKVFTFLSTQMPDGAGGSLTSAQYQDVKAYIIAKNGYPAGETELDDTAARASAVPLISTVK